MIPAALLLQVATAAAPRPASKCAMLSDSVVATADSVPNRAVGFARTIGRACRNDFGALFRPRRAPHPRARLHPPPPHRAPPPPAPRPLRPPPPPPPPRSPRPP